MPDDLLADFQRAADALGCDITVVPAPAALKARLGLMEGKPHRCDEGCVCPVHGTPLIYWPAGDDHACQDPACGFAHGTLPDARPVEIRRRDPEEAARLIREGCREHGIPDDIAEAMIEGVLEP